MFLQLPFVSEVVTFAPFCVVVVHVPGDSAPPGSPGPLVFGGGLGSAGAASAIGAVIANATTIMAATVSIKMMRFISHLLFLHSPNASYET
jgi:hypothetical protein